MESETPLVNPTPAQLEVAVEENLVALFRAMAEVLPGSELVARGLLSIPSFLN